MQTEFEKIEATDSDLKILVDELSTVTGRDLHRFKFEIHKILDASMVQLSDIKPSDWYEKNRYMTSDVSPVEGMFSYDNSPYTREIVDCLAMDNPAQIIAVMKGAQVGFSASVIEAGVGYIISQSPGNILFMVGHESVLKDSVTKIDRMIDYTGLRKGGYIKSSSNRARKTKTGDTDTLKEFTGGYMKIGVANHGMLRQISMQYGFIDDYESMKVSDKSSGSTKEMIEQRFVSFGSKRKIFYISTPEVKETSNIEPVYLQGDQRKYHIPAPCCGEYIVLEWDIESEINENERAGITWQEDENGKLVQGSVGYTCQKCGGFFDDRQKFDFMKHGEWIPTAIPESPTYRSYHISSLYAPVYMAGWEYYVQKWIEIHPRNGVRNEEKYKTFVNLVLGNTYEPTGKSINATQLQKNTRSYKPGIVPNEMSIADGNGRIIMLTCGSDLNGTEDDARLDYEIVGFSESGANYSIIHGSIGTFQPGDGKNQKREKWTYRHGVRNNVWDEFEKIIKTRMKVDTGGTMAIFATSVDSGYMTNYAYQFVDRMPINVFALKGDDDTKHISQYHDAKSFKPAIERNKLYIVRTNYTKDILADDMGLVWNPKTSKIQPTGFMNFPQPNGGLYMFENYFSHFEAEHKVVDAKGAFRWVKKNQVVQNHLFDCRLYAIVSRDVFVSSFFGSMKPKVTHYTWADFVEKITVKA